MGVDREGRKGGEREESGREGGGGREGERVMGVQRGGRKGQKREGDGGVGEGEGEGIPYCEDYTPEKENLETAGNTELCYYGLQ